MEKKRSVGVTVFSTLFIVSAISGWARSWSHLKSFGFMGVLYARLMAILLLVIAIKILQLKEWARKGIIYYYIIVSLVAIFLIPRAVSLNIITEPEIDKMKLPLTVGLYIAILITAAVVIYFFTRPKVKEQFK